MTRLGTLAGPVVAMVLLAALAGCTPADCDPSRAELFAGIGCAASGSYAARETGLRVGLQQAQANALEQQANANRARLDEANAQHALDRKRNQLALLDGRLHELRRQIDAARQREGANQNALNEAQRELAALQARRATVTPQSNDAELRALEAPTRALDERLRQEGLR